MNQAIGDSIAFAVGVAISPLPIIAVILMLLSKRSAANSWAFVLGWVAGVAIALGVVLAVCDAIGITASSGSTTVHNTSTVRVVLGAVLVLMGLRRLRHRQGEGADTPKWLQTIESVGPGKAAGLGVVLAAVNPKNLILIIGGGTAIAGATTATGATVAAAVIFIVIAVSTVVLPAVVAALGGSRADAVLGSWRDWLGLHASALMGAVLLVIGVLLIGKGVGGF